MRETDSPETGEPSPASQATVDAANHVVVAQGGAAWGRPFARFDVLWTRFETALCTAVLALEIVALAAWIALRGLSTPPGAGLAGTVFRALTGGLVLGSIGYFALRRRAPALARFAGAAGFVIGLLLSRLWASAGVNWASNLLNWYQQGSGLTLVGGLRGLGTRLTLLLALLGGSLATAAGKHVTIDLVTRFVQPRVRVPVVLFGWLGAAIVCLATSWGFFDHIAIENYGARADAPALEKVGRVGHGLSEGWFVARRQLELDVQTFPRVVAGESYSEWLSGARWNEWVRDGGFAERYGAAAAKQLELPPDATKTPIVVIPGHGEARGELVKASNLVLPIGLAILAMRFLLLIVLVLSRHRTIDPEPYVEPQQAEVV